MTLRPVEFHILLALAADERHGYGLLQEVANLTDGELQIEPGTLYRALHRMLKAGWVVESARRPAADVDDERRRYYRLTPAGRPLPRARGGAAVPTRPHRARAQVARPCLTSRRGGSGGGSCAPTRRASVRTSGSD